MSPCGGYLQAWDTVPLWAARFAEVRSSLEPTWWDSYGIAVSITLGILTFVLAYDIWAQLTGRLTISNMIRRGPGWLKVLVGGGLAWLWVHLLLQGGGSKRSVMNGWS